MTDNAPKPGEAIMAASPPRLPIDEGSVAKESSAKEPAGAVELPDAFRRRSFWRQHGITMIVAGVVSAAVAAAVSMGVPLIWGRGGQTLSQQGKFWIGAGAGQDVYYPIPYSSPPNLQVELSQGHTNLQHMKIIEQKPDHFKIDFQSPLGGGVEFRWRAEGLRRDR
jgi:hypothetical protein